MRDCLLLVDVFGDFRHEDGGALLASFRERFAALRSLLHESRQERIPVVYANDSAGVFDGDARGIVDRARAGPAAAEMAELAPQRGDRFVVKPRDSAFDPRARRRRRPRARRAAGGVAERHAGGAGVPHRPPVRPRQPQASAFWVSVLRRVAIFSTVRSASFSSARLASSRSTALSSPIAFAMRRSPSYAAIS